MVKKDIETIALIERVRNAKDASMFVRHTNDGKLYLYDILDIKKETSNPIEP